MTSISFPLTTMPGRHPQESAGRLINAYAEPLGDEMRWSAARRRVPGFSTWGTTAGLGFRGGISIPAAVYGAWNGDIYAFSTSGGAGVLHGSFIGSEKSFWAKNNNSTIDVVAVDPSGTVSLVTASGVVSYPDADVGAPNSVCFLDGYFFFTYGNGLCRASGINSTSINTLDVVTAEAKSDTLYRPIPFNNQLFLCGSGSIEVFSGNPVNDEGFPFNRITVISRGLAGRYCIAGHEDGFGKALIFVGDDNAVYLLNGYTPEKISPPDLDYLIEQVTDKNTLEVSVYVSGGRAVFVISSLSWTWEFSLNSLKWNERQSYQQSRWRGTQTFNAYGKWLSGDTDSGELVELSSIRTETGDPLRMTVISAPVAKFPTRGQIARIDLDVTVGRGISTGSDPNQTDPTLEISVSRDGGVNFDTPRMCKIGPQAIADQRVYATRFGLSTGQGAVVKVDLSDDVDVALMGGDMFDRQVAR